MSSLPCPSFLEQYNDRKRTESTQSETDGQHICPPRERHFSFTSLFTRSTSVEDALKRDSKYLTDGDGYDKDKYVKGINSGRKQMEFGGTRPKSVNLDDEMLRQNRILHNEDGFERRDYIRSE